MQGEGLPLSLTVGGQVASASLDYAPPTVNATGCLPAPLAGPTRGVRRVSDVRGGVIVSTGGTLVTLGGKNFGLYGVVSLDGVPMTGVAWSHHSLSWTTPAGACPVRSHLL